MPKITLTTLNARYIHASLGLRYLKANMGELESSTSLQEYVITTRPIDIVEKLLSDSPEIIGFGVYIWNVIEITEVVSLLKTISPETIVILGGPEISFETENQRLAELADHIITGMADLAFGELCQKLLYSRLPQPKIIHAVQPSMADIRLPYDQFTATDIANRVVYVEASRGCPFKCEFCLSSLDKTAWPFDTDLFLASLQALYDKGLRHFKFVDRTFNLKINTSIRILDFFLAKKDSGLFLHFELIPDHLPEKLKSVILKFPDGMLQFEIGIQTFNPEVQGLISRKQDNQKAIDNICWLSHETTAHLHTDLIVGLPSEDMESFGRGFDQLVALNPGEIQVGILKRLRGTPIIRHTQAYDMRYNASPPYNILSNDCIDFYQMQVLSRFARYWDVVANSGRFKNTLPLFLGKKPFDRFLHFSNWLYETTDQTHKFELKRLFNLLHNYMTNVAEIPESESFPVLMADYSRSGQKGQAGFMKSTGRKGRANRRTKVLSGAKRQAIHAQ